MDMFSLLRSKKTSEAGIWVNDEEVVSCPLCHSAFNLLIRKHHCRKCGQVVCGRCSENRIFLESSRSGALKRVCDPCYARDRHPVPDDDEEEEEENVRRAMAKASVGSGASSGSAAGGSARAGGGPAGGSSASSGSKASSASPGGSDIPAEAVEALKGVSWAGKWKFSMVFAAVDMGKAGPAGMTPEAAASFSGAAAAGAGKGAGAGAGAAVRVGSKVVIHISLKPKGAAYFQGECPEFGQFGKEGKVTGALQRGTGKVSMTLSIVHPVTKVTTSFNCVGYCNGKGEYVGNFTGCEISKSAGTCAGVFTGVQVEAEGGGAQEGEAAGAGSKGKKGAADSDEDSDAPKAGSKGGKKTGQAASKGKAKAKRKTSSSEDDSD